MEAAIRKEFGIGVNLKEGHGGIFEVAINDQVVYSNLKQCGRLPEAEEIFQKIRECQGSPEKSRSSAAGKEPDAQTQEGPAGSGCCCPGGARGQGEDSDDCCKPPQDDTTGGGGGSSGSRGKTLVFVAVMLIAIGVASYSFSKKYIARTQDPAQALSMPTGENRSGLSWRNPATFQLQSPAASVSCGVNLSALKGFKEASENKEAIFILLPDENGETPGAVTRHLNTVVKMLSDQGRRIGTLTLGKHREGYRQLIKQFSVQSLPSVIVAGSGCGSIAVSGEITELKLLQAFVQASMKPSSCGTPAGGSSCCPK